MATHEYPVAVKWTGGRDGSGSVTSERSQTSAVLAVPEEFGGAGEGTNPEELLTSAIASCYSITFGIVAANRKLPIASIDVRAVGQVEQQGASHVFRSVTIQPTILLTSGATDEQIRVADDLARKADSYCLITNAVRDKVSVSVEPSVSRNSE